MSTLSELIGFVRIKLNDPTILDETIKARINSVVKRVAGGVYDTKTGGLTPPLPELYEIGTVWADDQEAYTKLPSNYQRNLSFCATSTERITVYDSFAKFMRKFPLLDDTGDVHSVAVKSNLLYYQGTPSTSQELTIHYSREPAVLAVDADEPEGIPEMFQRDVVVPMVCELLVDSNSPLKAGFNAESVKAIAEMREFLGPEDKEPQYTEDSTEYL